MAHTLKTIAKPITAAICGRISRSPLPFKTTIRITDILRARGQLCLVQGEILFSLIFSINFANEIRRGDDSLVQLYAGRLTYLRAKIDNGAINLYERFQLADIRCMFR